MFKLELTEDELKCAVKALDYHVDEMSCHMNEKTAAEYRHAYQKLNEILLAKPLKVQMLDTAVREWKFMFDKYPTLKSVPICAWGRYYKYECSGEPFDQSCEVYLPEEMIYSYCIQDEDIRLAGFDEKLFKQITLDLDGSEEVEGIEESIFAHDTLVDVFGGDDERGGACLCLRKNDAGEFEFIVICCDSPE